MVYYLLFSLFHLTLLVRYLTFLHLYSWIRNQKVVLLLMLALFWGQDGSDCVKWLGGMFLLFIFPGRNCKRQMISSFKVWESFCAKPSEPTVFVVGIFLNVASVSLRVLTLFRLCIFAENNPRKFYFFSFQLPLYLYLFQKPEQSASLLSSFFSINIASQQTGRWLLLPLKLLDKVANGTPGGWLQRIPFSSFDLYALFWDCLQAIAS